MKSAMGGTLEHNGASRRRLGTHQSQRTRLNLDPLRPLSKRVHKTYLARLALAKRLQGRSLFWNGALVSLTLASTIASVGLLFNRALYGAQGGVVLVIMSVFVLVASLMVANARYSTRTLSAFNVYRELQRSSGVLWARVEGPFVRPVKAQRLHEQADTQYQVLLDNSENHSQGDYAAAITLKLATKARVERDRLDAERGKEDWALELVSLGEFARLSAHRIGRTLMTSIPCLLIAASAAFVVPTIVWLFGG
jgi:hypothetical protein